MAYVDAAYGSEEAGGYLKSDSGWLDSDAYDSDGSDYFKFTALPGGYCIVDNDQVTKETFFACYGMGTEGLWWSETEYDVKGSYTFILTSDDASFNIKSHEKEDYASVRCIKAK